MIARTVARRGSATSAVALVATALVVAAPNPSNAAHPGHQQRATHAGALLSSHRATADLLPGTPLARKAWHITYRSTSPTGRAITVSGTVLVPSAAYRGKRPLVGFAVGSQGLADRCAPSAALASGTEYEASEIATLLAKGWAVAVTDYPGLGTPGDHTYAIGRSLGPAVLDSMRAARELPPAHLAPNGPVAIMGYSEGGGAAGWAVQLQPTYAPDLHLVGAAVGGVIADLHVIAHHLDGGAFSFLIPYTAIGMAAAYPHVHLQRYLTPAGRADVAKLRQSCLADASSDYPPFTKSRSITTRDLFTLPVIERIIASNHLGRRAPAAPVLLQQSPTDEILPYSQAVALDRQWCRAGGRIDFRTQPAPDHVTGGVEANPVAVAWLAQRFAHQPLGKQCGPVPIKEQR